MLTSEGEKDIEDIRAGDRVLAEDAATGEQEYREVLETYIHEVTVIVHVYVGGEEIETTVNHPFYVEGEGFTAAGDLMPGDLIRTADGQNYAVEAVETEQTEEPVPVYNLEVEDYHTYYVSELQVLVHNKCIDRNSPESYSSYKELKKNIGKSGLSGKNKGLEAHHLLEKQYAEKFGITDEGSIISVALTPKWHRNIGGMGVNIDKRIQRELRKIVGVEDVKLAKSIATPEQIWTAHKKVYLDIGHEDWASALYNAYVNKLGIKY